MADALCGPSNALQNFQKHTAVDRTLQQDRLVSRQSPTQVHEDYNLVSHFRILVADYGNRDSDLLRTQTQASLTQNSTPSKLDSPLHISNTMFHSHISLSSSR